MTLRLQVLYQRASVLLGESLKTCKYAKIFGNECCYSTFGPRDFIAHDSHGESGTLQSNFVKHIAMSNCKTDDLVPRRIKYSDFYPIHNIQHFRSVLHKTPSDQLPFLIVMTSIYMPNGDARNVADALNDIDSVLMKRKHEFDTKLMLKVLYAIMYLAPNKITRFDFYSFCVTQLTEELTKTATKDTFVQACFYAGLQKKAKNNQELVKNLLEDHLESFVEDLNELEFAIISNAAFKAAVQIRNAVYKKKSIEFAINCGPKNSSLFVTFIKNLRLNRFRNGELYEKLKSLLLAGAFNKFQFKGLCHVYAYFADDLQNDPQVCGALTEKCLEKLETSTDSELYRDNDGRAKDIATFLWCNAYLCNEQLSKSDFHFLEQTIINKLGYGEYQRCIDAYVDTVLSLWMLGHKSEQLVNDLFALVKPNSFKDTRRVRLDSRFVLLRTCVQIEKPDWVPTNFQSKVAFAENREAPSYLVNKRDNFVNVHKVLKENANELGINSCQLIVPFEELNVPSILVKLDDQKKYFVEVLDDQQELRYNKQPISIVQLKLRLLEAIGANVVLVRTTDKTNDDILKYIKENIESNGETIKAHGIT